MHRLHHTVYTIGNLLLISHPAEGRKLSWPEQRLRLPRRRRLVQCRSVMRPRDRETGSGSDVTGG